MTLGLAIATVAGGFLFPFAIRMMWDKFVELYGAFGGWMSAAFIVGTIWAINHGLSTPMITQTGAWIDMAWAAGIGLLVATIVKGGNFTKAIPNIFYAIIGGTLAGFILSLFL
ncbi:hypothetical protein V6C31_07845 [Caldibacillus debilis]|jgi:hypothetical protein|uniref:Lin0368 family putative glycerol transporter subunit n=1 Tax=Caldibacillus debilis TaxID=301148 RepID=UPI002FDA4FD7